MTLALYVFIAECDGDLVGVLHHVVIGHDISVVADDHTGT